VHDYLRLISLITSCEFDGIPTDKAIPKITIITNPITPKPTKKDFMLFTIFINNYTMIGIIL